MWFEVPLPFFLRDAVYGLGWERVAVGAMLAVRFFGFVCGGGGVPRVGGRRDGECDA